MSFIGSISKYFTDHWLGLVAITCLVLTIVLPITYYEHHYRHSGWLVNIENNLIDVRHRLLSDPKQARDDVVILDITERALNLFRDSLGRWPWPRTIYSKIFEHLKGADSVTVDIGFWEPSETEVSQENLETIDAYFKKMYRFSQKPDKQAEIKQLYRFASRQLSKLSTSPDESLADGTRRFGPVIHATQFAGSGGRTESGSSEVYKRFFDQFGYRIRGSENVDFPSNPTLSMPIEELFETTRIVGHINHVPDDDGITRRFQPFVGLPDNRQKRLDIEKPYIPVLGLGPYLTLINQYPDKTDLQLTENSLSIGDRVEIPIKSDGTVLINYAGGIGTFERVPIECVITRLYDQNFCEEGFSPEWFKGKKVLIGASAGGLFDLRATPFSATQAGTSIHANILDMFLRGNFLEPIKFRDTAAASVLLALTVGCIAGFLNPVVGFVLTFLLLVLYFVTGLGLYNQNYLINLSTPLIAASSNYVLITLSKLIAEQQRRRQVRNAFESYLASSVMEEVLENPDSLELGGERQEITVMFADVSGFTSFSEGRTATEVASVIGEVMTALTDCVFGYEGVLDKYIGDELVAEFGMVPGEPPEHPRRAVNAACDMLDRLKELQEEWREQGDEVLDLRIGLHTGHAATGNMGSEMLFDYTAIGDNVNLGSRLEGANKQYNTRCMMSESTYEETRDIIEARELDKIVVKGKEEPVSVYQLLGREGEVDDEQRKLRDDFEEGLRLYRNKNWKEAIKQFEGILDEFPDDGPSEVFLERSKEYRDNPPQEDWNGVYRLKTK